MTIFALILVFIPFFSAPPFIFSSYVQPFTLFVGWSILLYTLNMRFSVNVLTYLSVFFFYVLTLKFYVFGSGIIDGDISVLIAYIVAFLQILLFLSLFRLVFSRCVSGDMFLFQRVQKAFDFSILIVAASVPLQLIGPIGHFLDFIKPRSLELSDSGLAQSYRGLSGLMPEPSYVGSCLGMLLLSSFLLGYFRFSCLQLNPLVSKTNFSPKCNSLDFAHYSRYLKLFTGSYSLYIFLSIVAVFLAFSPTTLLSFACIISLTGIPFVAQALTGIVRSDFLRYLLIVVSVCLGFFFLSNALFGQSRLASYFNMITSGDFLMTLSRDASFADRYASSALGVFSIFSYPLGLGLNGHGAILSECSNQIVQSLELMCGSIWNSGRNHNAMANLVIDGGLFSGILIFLLIKTSRLDRLFGSAFVHPILRFSLVAFPVFILSIFIVLPAPLGSPFAWLPFCTSLAFLRELPSAFDGSNEQHVKI